MEVDKFNQSSTSTQQLNENYSHIILNIILYRILYAGRRLRRNFLRCVQFRRVFGGKRQRRHWWSKRKCSSVLCKRYFTIRLPRNYGACMTEIIIRVKQIPLQVDEIVLFQPLHNYVK